MMWGIGQAPICNADGRRAAAWWKRTPANEVDRGPARTAARPAIPHQSHHSRCAEEVAPLAIGYTRPPHRFKRLSSAVTLV